MSTLFLEILSNKAIDYHRIISTMPNIYPLTLWTGDKFIGLYDYCRLRR